MCLFKKTPWDLENDINKNEGNGIFTSENVFDYVPSVAWNSFRQDISWRVCYRRGRGGGAGVLSYICCEGYGLQEV